jgi:hypothetical protein
VNWDSKKGDWVQISRVILEPKERASQLPEDTKKVPLTLLVKGFLNTDANIGDTVTITTVVGRTENGKLVAVNPGYNHSFGPPPKGLMGIGNKLKEL